MITEKDSEIKVIKYAEKNNYTILANTFGSLEYVKYCHGKNLIAEFLKWPKGSDSLIITKEGISKKIKLSEVN